jgi:hypothetical protein
MKLRQHATRCSLCSAHYGVLHRPRTNLPCLQIFFHTFHGPFLIDSKTLIKYHSGFPPVLYRSGASFRHVFIGPSGNWPVSTRFILQQFPAILKTREPSEDCTTRSSLYTFFRSLHFSGSFPRFKVKFNHVMLPHVDTFDTEQTHA